MEHRKRPGLMASWSKSGQPMLTLAVMPDQRWGKRAGGQSRLERTSFNGGSRRRSISLSQLPRSTDYKPTRPDDRHTSFRQFDKGHGCSAASPCCGKLTRHERRRMNRARPDLCATSNPLRSSPTPHCSLTAILHIAAVVVTELREGGSLISAMFTGRKLIAGTPVDLPDHRPKT